MTRRRGGSAAADAARESAAEGDEPTVLQAFGGGAEPPVVTTAASPGDVPPETFTASDTVPATVPFAPVEDAAGILKAAGMSARLAVFLAEDAGFLFEGPKIKRVLRTALEHHGIEFAREVAAFLERPAFKRPELRGLVKFEMVKIEATAKIRPRQAQAA